MPLMKDIMFGIFGLSVLLGIAFLFSNNKRKINLRLVFTGLGLQLLFAVFVLMTPWGAIVFDAIARFFVVIISFTFDGASFVFGEVLSKQDVSRYCLLLFSFLL